MMMVAGGAFAQQCPVGQIWDDCNHPSVGPGPCVPGCIPDPNAPPPPGPGPTGPNNLCIAGVCHPVVYTWFGKMAVAESKVTASGYPVMGWAGPCLFADIKRCPDIRNQAFLDLKLNALRANRAMDAE